MPGAVARQPDHGGSRRRCWPRCCSPRRRCAGRGRRRSSEISRLLEPHVDAPRPSPSETPRARLPGFESLLAWTERSLDDLPGSERLTAVARALRAQAARAATFPISRSLAAFVFGAGRHDHRRTARARAPADARRPRRAVRRPARSPPGGGRRRSTGSCRTSWRRSPRRSAPATASGPALRAIADDGAAPSSEEFARVLGEERLGRPLDEAIAAMCERIGSPDLEYVATADQRPVPDRRLARRPLRHAVGDRSRAAAARPQGQGADRARPDVGDRPRRRCRSALGGADDADQPRLHGAAVHDARAATSLIGVCLTSMAIGCPVPQAHRLGEVLAMIILLVAGIACLALLRLPADRPRRDAERERRAALASGPLRGGRRCGDAPAPGPRSRAPRSRLRAARPRPPEALAQGSRRTTSPRSFAAPARLAA